MLGLTPNQKKVLDFIKSKGDVPPTFTEIMANTGIKSTSAVFNLLTALEQRGHIRRRHGAARAIEVVSPWQDISTAPDDNREIWVWGGKYKTPSVVPADGAWWRGVPLPGVTPTHWMEYVVPEPPEAQKRAEKIG